MGEILGSFRQFASRRPVVRRAAAMVIIAFINHGDLSVSGAMARMEWVKIGITFLVPYSVSTISSVLAVNTPSNMPRTLNAGLAVNRIAADSQP